MYHIKLDVILYYHSFICQTNNRSRSINIFTAPFKICCACHQILFYQCSSISYVGVHYVSANGCKSITLPLYAYPQIDITHHQSCIVKFLFRLLHVNYQKKRKLNRWAMLELLPRYYVQDCDKQRMIIYPCSKFYLDLAPSTIQGVAIIYWRGEASEKFDQSHIEFCDPPRYTRCVYCLSNNHYVKQQFIACVYLQSFDLAL